MEDDGASVHEIVMKPARNADPVLAVQDDAPNLHITDASVFVTGSAMNPTATAQAWALRCADHIAAETA